MTLYSAELGNPECNLLTYFRDPAVCGHGMRGGQQSHNYVIGEKKEPQLKLYFYAKNLPHILFIKIFLFCLSLFIMWQVSFQVRES